jgi:hypothetical protein
MLENITEKCIDLLLEHRSPVTHNFTTDFNHDARTLYQRFAFIRSILQSGDFRNAVHKMMISPVTNWKETGEFKDIRRIRKMDGRILRQIAGSGNRIELLQARSLHNRLHSIPSRVTMSSKTESQDTPENRFVKYALRSFCALVADFRSRAKADSRLFEEALTLESQLDVMLSHPVFQDVGNPVMLSLNSPILQRKEGYKEVLRVWLMFDLAARLIWRGGNDVYDAGKKDVAILYEYWLFFQLLDLIREVFEIESDSIESLIKPTSDGLGLQLKKGKHIALQGIFNGDSRKLNVEFSFNRSFSFKWKGFHEVFPGLGAFAVRPSKTHSGIQALRNFLKDVTQHFLDRASQREKSAFHSYEIYKSEQSEAIRESLPETWKKSRPYSRRNICHHRLLQKHRTTHLDHEKQTL